MNKIANTIIMLVCSFIIVFYLIIRDALLCDLSIYTYNQGGLYDPVLQSDQRCAYCPITMYRSVNVLLRFSKQLRVYELQSMSNVMIKRCVVV